MNRRRPKFEWALPALLILALAVGERQALTQRRGAVARSRRTLPPADARYTQFRGRTDNSGFIDGEAKGARWSLSLRGPIRGVAVAGSLLVVGTDSGELTAVSVVTGQALWHARVHPHIHNDPVIVDGRVFATFGDLPIATSAGGIVAVDSHTGEILWGRQFGSSVMASPAFASGSIIVASGDGCVTGLAPATGALRWRRCLDLASAMSNPRVDGDNLYLGSVDGKLCEIGASDGNVHWIHSYPKERHLGDVTVAVLDSLVVTTGTEWPGVRAALTQVGFRASVKLIGRAIFADRLVNWHNWFLRQHLIAVDKRTGAMRWSRDLVMDVEISRNLSGNPAIAGDLVLVSSPVSRRIFAFRLADGRALWQRALFARHRGSITIFHGLALVAEQDGSIEAFDVLSGEQRGRCSWGSPATPFAPLVVGNTFLYGGSDGVLRALPVDVLLTSFGSLPGASCVH